MRQFGIIGFPLGHSFSKKYFTEKFDRENIEAEYLNFPIGQINSLTDILAAHPGLCGFNVTIPHKQHILPYLTELSEEARKIGAVNCVRIRYQDGKTILSGYNTDAYGFRKALLNFLPERPEKALILGNGGAAKAVRFVLDSLGTEVLTVSRTPKNEKEISYADIPHKTASFKLIVNTTPLGTWPATEGYPDIPYHLLTPEHYLFDLVYNPEITEFMKRGMKNGAHVCNGLEMLTGQAEAGWAIWNESPSGHL